MPVHFVATIGSNLGQLFVNVIPDVLIRVIPDEGAANPLVEPIVRATLDP